MSIIDEIKQTFKSGSNLTKLIYLNLAIFILVNLVEIFYFLLNRHDSYSAFLLTFAVPADLQLLIRKPWTPITYMFLHKNFLHILFNLLWLYWFGRIFLEYLDGKKLVGVYILGGLSGAFLYILAYNIFPVFFKQLQMSYALGASAAVMAIVISISVYVPNYSVYLLFIGRVKIIYIAIIGFLVTSLFDFSINTGGKIAHIGGALFGFLFILQYRKGRDMTRGLSRFLDAIIGLFKPKPKVTVTHRRSETDYDYNIRKKEEQVEIDRILDKIAKSGYDSLTKQEKDILFRQSKN
jgi:membrane associated rhomboid family serine protease